MEKAVGNVAFALTRLVLLENMALTFAVNVSAKSLLLLVSSRIGE